MRALASDRARDVPPGVPGAAPSASRRGALVLALTEARLLVRSPLLWGAAVLGIALGIVLGWTRMPDWGTTISHANEAALVLGAALLLAGHLAASRSNRYAMAESLDVLPLSARRRTVALLGVTPLAALLAMLVLAVQLLALLPDRPAGRLDLSNLLAVVAVPVLGFLLGVALGTWLPVTAAGPLGLVAVATLVLTLPMLGRIGGWLAPVAPGESYLPGAPRPTGWHLLYLVALGAVFGAVALLRHRRPVPATAATVALAVAMATVAPQLAADPGFVTEELEARYTGRAVLECEEHTGVRYCALPGYGRWISVWRAAVDPVVAVVPPTARAGLPLLRQYGNSWSKPPEPTVATGLVWGRHGRWAADSRTALTTVYARVAAGLPAPGGDGTPPRSGAATTGSGGCWAGGQARTVVALWLAAQALPDGERLLRAHKINLYPARYGQPEIDAAAALLAEPRARVAATLAPAWDRVTAGPTGVELLAALGLPVRPRPSGSGPAEGPAPEPCS